MMRGTTPTHIFTLPFDVSRIKEIRIIYSQNDTPVVTKNTADCTLENKTVTVKLTQEDTFAFNHKKPAFVQLHVLSTNGDALTSAIKAISIGDCLDKEVIK